MGHARTELSPAVRADPAVGTPPRQGAAVLLQAPPPLPTYLSPFSSPLYPFSHRPGAGGCPARMGRPAQSSVRS